MNTAHPAVYVDADACPVKEECMRVAERHNSKVFLVCNGGLRPSPHPLVELVIVSEGPDEADIWIADSVNENDIVITADILLAEKALENGASAINHDGEVFTTANIGNKVAMRDLMADIRAADPYAVGKGKPFSKADRSRFLNSLERMLVAKKKAST